jgi:hypothetical protein
MIKMEGCLFTRRIALGMQDAVEIPGTIQEDVVAAQEEQVPLDLEEEIRTTTTMPTSKRLSRTRIQAVLMIIAQILTPIPMSLSTFLALSK